MARLMSVSLTEQAVIDRRKTVTRRLGWKFLRPGDRLTLCRKVMGRQPDEPLVRLAEVEVVDVRREPLSAITPDDIMREGLGYLTPFQFVEFFCSKMLCEPSDLVTRIEWRYLDDPLDRALTAVTEATDRIAEKYPTVDYAGRSHQRALRDSERAARRANR